MIEKRHRKKVIRDLHGSKFSLGIALGLEIIIKIKIKTKKSEEIERERGGLTVNGGEHDTTSTVVVA